MGLQQQGDELVVAASGIRRALANVEILGGIGVFTLAAAKGWALLAIAMAAVTLTGAMAVLPHLRVGAFGLRWRPVRRIGFLAPRTLPERIVPWDRITGVEVDYPARRLTAHILAGGTEQLTRLALPTDPEAQRLLDTTLARYVEDAANTPGPG